MNPHDSRYHLLQVPNANCIKCNIDTEDDEDEDIDTEDVDDDDDDKDPPRINPHVQSTFAKILQDTLFNNDQ